MRNLIIIGAAIALALSIGCWNTSSSSDGSISLSGASGPLDFGDIMIDQVSAPKEILLTGVALAAEAILVTIPTGFQVALSESASWEDTLSIQWSGGSGETSFWVRFRPTTEATASGNVVATLGSMSGSLAVTGNGIAPAFAGFNPTSLAFGNCIVYDRPSQEATVTLSASSLTGDIDITIYSDFEFAIDAGGPYGKNALLSPLNGTINQTLWLRFSPLKTGLFTGQIGVTGGGLASEAILQLTGTGDAESEGSVSSPILLTVGTRYEGCIAGDTDNATPSTHSYYTFEIMEAGQYRISVSQDEDKETNWNPYLYVYTNADFTTGVVYGASCDFIEPTLQVTRYYLDISNTWRPAVFHLDIQKL